MQNHLASRFIYIRRKSKKIWVISLHLVPSSCCFLFWCYSITKTREKGIYFLPHILPHLSSLPISITPFRTINMFAHLYAHQSVQIKTYESTLHVLVCEDRSNIKKPNLKGELFLQEGFIHPINWASIWKYI